MVGVPARTAALWHVYHLKHFAGMVALISMILFDCFGCEPAPFRTWFIPRHNLIPNSTHLDYGVVAFGVLRTLAARATFTARHFPFWFDDVRVYYYDV